jgi:hypothetical protein
MRLKKVLEIYRAKKQLPTEEGVKEIFENVEPEPVTKNLDIPQILPSRRAHGFGVAAVSRGEFDFRLFLR